MHLFSFTQPHPSVYTLEMDARLRAYCRRILARLPHSSILHHWRLPFLLVSRKSQPQSPRPGHCLTLLTSSEVKSSTADRTRGQSIWSRASSRLIQFHAKPLVVGMIRACVIPSANVLCNASRSAVWGIVLPAIAEKTL